MPGVNGKLKPSQKWTSLTVDGIDPTVNDNGPTALNYKILTEELIKPFEIG
ncbi:hypothetical protein DDB_G0284723 [Dictyostelium discoideum AX4]|uniref:Uncharacterized protein n=1 Tax=Dictyostelium discoideum TaxID=44689 RepID=Q54PB9_DICDI|nr:hypothetical protein DDB_G0284723 [Dictyostelium discoideum AX4]EAL65131.1 hypothetical protein DDB_G0284723 [Dictyostelium discoideum AX4]|eukprot:XP_638456.1 hypothetical protein DDB_G0284723 [Dictyostelium discoideum AX4]